MNKIGSTFIAECQDAGVSLEGVAMARETGELHFTDVPQDRQDAVLAIFAAHDPAASALTDAKLGAIERIQSGCNFAMIAGITCNALGSDHTYPTKNNDQVNMAAVVLAANIYGVAKEPYKFWCADAAGVWARREHTAAQIIAVGDVVRAHVTSNQDKWERKLSDIAAAAALPTPTQADFDAIVWTDKVY